MSETKDKSDVGGKDAVADAQRRSFRMDPALLWSVIKSQAGTLAKALLLKYGTVSPGDLLAPPPDDPRLVPGYTASGDAAFDDLFDPGKKN